MNDQNCLQRRAFTLVELLVVIGIVLIMASVAIPTVRFLTRDRQIREASRMVTSFIEAARNEAMSTGSEGVWFERDANDPNKCRRVFRTKVPAPYSGDTYDAVAYIETASSRRAYVNQSENFIFFDRPDAPSRGTDEVGGGIRVGDFIQFDHRGPRFPILRVREEVHPVGGAPAFELTLDDSRFKSPPNQSSLSYTIYRQPVRKNFQFIELPKNTYIDLSNSGFAGRLLGSGSPARLLAPVDTDTGIFVADPDASGTDTHNQIYRGGVGNEFASRVDGSLLAKTLPLVLTFDRTGSVDRLFFEYYDSTGFLFDSFTNPSKINSGSSSYGTAFVSGGPNSLAESRSGERDARTDLPTRSIFFFVATDNDQVNDQQSTPTSGPSSLQTGFDNLNDMSNTWVMISKGKGKVTSNVVAPSSGALDVDGNNINYDGSTSPAITRAERLFASRLTVVSGETQSGN